MCTFFSALKTLHLTTHPRGAPHGGCAALCGGYPRGTPTAQRGGRKFAGKLTKLFYKIAFFKKNTFFQNNLDWPHFPKKYFFFKIKNKISFFSKFHILHVFTRGAPQVPAQQKISKHFPRQNLFFSKKSFWAPFFKKGRSRHLFWKNTKFPFLVKSYFFGKKI